MDIFMDKKSQYQKDAYLSQNYILIQCNNQNSMQIFFKDVISWFCNYMELQLKKKESPTKIYCINAITVLKVLTPG